MQKNRPSSKYELRRRSGGLNARRIDMSDVGDRVSRENEEEGFKPRDVPRRSKGMSACRASRCDSCARLPVNSLAYRSAAWRSRVPARKAIAQTLGAAFA